MLPQKHVEGILEPQALVQMRVGTFELEFWRILRVPGTGEAPTGLPLTTQ